MNHLFKCEAKYLDRLNNGNRCVHKLFSLIREENIDYIIFEVLPNLTYRQYLTTEDVRHHFSFLNTVPGLIWVTKP
jgi:hypothetical protein